MASHSSLRANILSVFKLSGLNLRSDATIYLMEILTPVENEAERNSWLQKIVNFVLKQTLTSSLLGRETIESVVKECSQQTDDDENIFNVIQSYDIPKFEFLTERKKFVQRNGLKLAALDLFGTPEDKSLLYKERYDLIRQRVVRHELFAPNSVPESSEKKTFDLKTVESLLASPGSVDFCVCLGMLSQLKENKFFLEDPSGSLEVDLTDSRFQTGLFTENSVVLIEGRYNDGILRASAVGLPPIETAEKTRQCYGNVNFFGGSSNVSVKTLSKLSYLERQLSSSAFVFIADVWLDDTKVLDKLRQMFVGFSDNPPFCFVICGQFLSKAYGYNYNQALKDGFKTLVEIIQEFPSLANQSHFVFVPSSHEPLLTNILPTPPLPSSLLQSVLCKLPNCYLATNPCRIQYCTQEIIIFREDIVEKMCRNCVKMPSDCAEIPQHFVRTILSQTHLSPLPLHVSPVNWAFDYALRLYSLPDLIVFADKYHPYTEMSNECIITNPGSFAKNEYSFQFYYPSTKQIDNSLIPNDD